MAFVTQMERAKAGAVAPIWFASYPAGVPKSIDPDAYPSLPPCCSRPAGNMPSIRRSNA